MGVAGWGLASLNDAIWWQLFAVCICIVIYTLTITRFKTEKQVLQSFIKQFKK